MARQCIRMVLSSMIGVLAGLAIGTASAQVPNASDLVDNNTAFIKLDKVNTSIGGAFGMHFISTLTINGQIWSYYIKWVRDSGGIDRGGIGLAKSTDGINFTDYGLVLPAGTVGAVDGTYATFPGAWYENGVFYLVYEAANGVAGYNGDIGLATSSDGVNFTKQGIILWHNQSGWERVNIGTPSLTKVGATWYLHYHGYNGDVCQVGVATGTDLFHLTKFSGNPIIPTVPGTWQSGTIGRRGITSANGKYFMVYEGSTAKPYDTARWSSGMASSTDLVHWTNFSQNAVLPQTASGMANDGPTFVEVGGLNYIYFRSSPTRRALIANESVGGFDKSWRMTDGEIGHISGRLENDGSWSVNTHQDTQSYAQFGPYYTGIPVGDNIATWKMAIDNNSAENLEMVRLEVVDYDDNFAVIAQRGIRRMQWKQPARYEYFSVPFNLPASRAGHRIELRVYWYGMSYLKIQTVGIS